MRKYVWVSLTLLLVIPVILFFLFFIWAKQESLKPDEKFSLYHYEFPYNVPSDTLRILTFNIGYLSGMTNNLPQARERKLFNQNLENSISVLRALSPDLIGLQEIDFRSNRSFFVDQAKELATSLEFPEMYRSVNWDVHFLPYPYGPPQYYFGKTLSGQTIFSKFPVTDSETRVLSKPASESAFYNTFYIDRLVQILDVKIGSRDVKVMNVHLEAFDEPTRVEQAYVVKEIFESWSDLMPVILMGDFNSAPEFELNESEAMKVIMTSNHIASCVSQNYYDGNKRELLTFSTGAPEIMIDYVLFNDNFLDCVEVKRIDEAGEISDHFPIFCKVVFTEEIE
ncbi:endonuclease/exonuclease/phosphatase family protein [Marinoscillum sp. MHG1-6]|uniref:endonuclease/exonuclease/phosphatase family protein n=1 Tax=Marinoscillum sp. MHG1-6 TaxID=2959627 RepID=UPI0021571398|nr:endonuclease/exonuclease/phosphatase family protein [Marinoscillum sp. MHG1-6]